MEPSKIGLGLHTNSNTFFPQDHILSTAPASPTGGMPPKTHTTRQTQQEGMPTSSMARTAPEEHSTLAQLSFGPATQQTVVTTTTTTTVSLPPLIMNPPKNLTERDPKHYPLAYSPTPQSLKRFAFDVNGKPTTFHESEDPQETARRFQEMQAKIQRHNGRMQKEMKQGNFYGGTESRQPLEQQGMQKQNSRDASAGNKRTATPVSLADAAEIASMQRKSKKPRAQLERTRSRDTDVQPLMSFSEPERNVPRRLTSLTMSPVTPDTDAGAAQSQAGRQDAKTKIGKLRSRVKELKSQGSRVELDDTDMADGDSNGEEAQQARSEVRTTKRSLDEGAMAGMSGSAATPPVAETDMEPIEADATLGATSNPFQRPSLPSLLTSSQQDASLPSPSLSPITAAANAASRANTFDVSFGRHIAEDDSTVSGLDLDEDGGKTQSASSFDSLDWSKKPQVPPFNFAQGPPQPQSNQGPTVMDIPTMVDAFDAMPEALQSYVMYQFLRRCAKPTLQMVAGVVNPALKCDPFNVLPAELGLNITRYLDAQSMCRAAQVSKRWRHLINTDERAWKDLLDRDNFTLPHGEIAKAVREGWGWQHPGEDGHEQDLSRAGLRQTPEPTIPKSPSGMPLASDEDDTSSTTVTTRAKRKSHIRLNNHKKLKRKSLQMGASNVKPSKAEWKQLLQKAQGPNGYATIASQAVPHPSIGLKSLKNMHLFKALYQRHYLIRKAWMQEESKPQHLAFRAHHRHVVTCLLFDSDKILTGSDDTKINVYDTKTGALRKKLEGHEGGVWALQYDGDTLVSGSTDRSVRIWDIKTGRCNQVFQGHTSTVRCLVILNPVQIGTAPDGTPVMMPKEPLIITGSRDSTLRVWRLPQKGETQVHQAGPPANDSDNPYFLRTLTGHHNSVRAIAAHGDTLISGSYDCTVRVWEISTGNLLHRLQGHTQKVYSVVLDTGRNRCISGSMDNLVKVWDLSNGSCLFNLEGHTSLVGLLDLSHDRLVSAAADSTLRIWDPEQGSCKATLSAHTGAITCFQHDGQKVISGSDRTLKMWNVKNGECVRDLLTDLSGVWQVRFDERRCVAAVQRDNLTYIEVLDFGAQRDGVGFEERGQRVVVDSHGNRISEPDAPTVQAEAGAEAEAAG
ncbi:hypothetical protein MBLNU230_g4349t1 [Neophaeotheca triangularis]